MKCMRHTVPVVVFVATTLCLTRLALGQRLGTTNRDDELCRQLTTIKSKSFDPETALPICTRAAQNGDADADWSLCSLYAQGLVGNGQNLEKAAIWCKAGGEAGQPAAAYQYANMLLDGDGVDQDADSALVWLKRARMLGNVAADRDIQVLTEAATRADPGSIARIYYSAAEAYLNQTPPMVARSAAWMHRAADLGLDIAQLAFGRMMVDGDGLAAPQPEIGATYLLQAAQQGNSEAMFYLGVLKAQRSVDDGQISDGVSLIQRAADLHFPPAMSEYGFLLQNGSKFVAKDLVRAAGYLRAAAEGGSDVGEYNWGITLLEGLGILPDRAKALYWLNMAAESNVVEAQLALGRLYSGLVPSDDKGSKDPVKAEMWLTRAAAADSAEADFFLGRLAEADQRPVGGSGAREWYLKAATLGDAAGALELARSYSNDHSSAASLEEAYQWANTAASFYSDADVARDATTLRTKMASSISSYSRLSAALESLRWLKANFPDRYSAAE